MTIAKINANVPIKIPPTPIVFIFSNLIFFKLFLFNYVLNLECINFIEKLIQNLQINNIFYIFYSLN